MNKPVIYMFSGQGSHYYRMGQELFEKNSTFKKWMQSLDHIVKDLVGLSIIDRLYDKKNRKSDLFNKTIITHPAIFMTEYSLYMTLSEKSISPDYVIGASMGEFAAAAVSGILDYEEALKAIIKQAELFENLCERGGMTTIVHKQTLLNESRLHFKYLEPASDNYDGHFVVSGGNDQLKEIEMFLKDNGIIYQNLPVSQGFHSSMIDPAESDYCKYLSAMNFKTPFIPFVSCAKTGVVPSVSKTHFWEVVRKPVEFQKTIKKFEQSQNNIYIDLGPSGTLATFVKYNLSKDSGSEIFSIMTPFSRDLKNLKTVESFFSPLKQSYNSELSNKTATRGNEMEKYVLLFPGQGSQVKGMGRVLFDKYPDLTNLASEILAYDLKELCLNDPDQKLNETQYTQPAIYVVNALAFYQMEEEERNTPAFALGHSLGEYNALLAAGAFDFETGLKLVKKRGELMSEASGGGMAAVIGIPPEEIRAKLEENSLSEVSLANYNTPTQTVISGPDETVKSAVSVLKESVKKVMPLKVSAPFHSPYMEDASKTFGEFLSGFTFNTHKFPVISNVTARPYFPEKTGELLTRQINSSVLWMDSIRYLMGREGELKFTELNSKILTRMVDEIRKNCTPIRDAEITEETKEPESSAPAFAEISSKEKEEDKDNQMKSSEESVSEMKKEKSYQSPLSERAVKKITPEMLGNARFRGKYGLEYAYIAGSMFRGIGSKEIVVTMANTGMIGFLGTGGLSLKEIEENILWIQEQLTDNQPYGMNLLHNMIEPKIEEDSVDIFLKHNIRFVEASAYMRMSPALLRYRISGLRRNEEGKVVCDNHIMGKCSRPEVAEQFLSPAPEREVKKLFDQGKITGEQMEMAKEAPVANEICVEADSGGHTDMGIPTVLLPGMLSLRKRMEEKYKYSEPIFMGLAGGIGSPQAALAAFIMGADFILTGSINQCTVEAGNSDAVKDMLQEINIQDTEYAPAGDMFELGAKVQVLKRGVFFPARANKLYQLYTQYNSLEEIPEKTRKQIEERYFKKSFDQVWRETREYLTEQNMTEDIKKAEVNPKHKMALVFRWYFSYSTRVAMSGDTNNRVDYQVHTGPALGVFNQWVKGTDLESWRNRHVDKIAKMILTETAKLLEKEIHQFLT